MAEKESNAQNDGPESGILAVVDRTREEITWVRSAYKFAVSLIAAVIAVGLYF